MLYAHRTMTTYEGDTSSAHMHLGRSGLQMLVYSRNKQSISRNVLTPPDAPQCYYGIPVQHGGGALLTDIYGNNPEGGAPSRDPPCPNFNNS